MFDSPYRYTTILADGITLITKYAQTYDVSVDLLLECNSQSINYYMLAVSSEEFETYNSTKDYLKDCLRKNIPPVQGLELRIPKLNSDDSNKMRYTYLDEQALVKSALGDWASSSVNYSELASLGGSNYLPNSVNYSDIAKLRTTSSLNYDYEQMHESLYRSTLKNTSLSILKAPSTFKCSYTILAGGSPVLTRYLPCPPIEISDENNVSFESIPIFGRSVPYQIYNGSGRQVGFSLSLHADLVENDSEYIYDLVSELQSLCYPEYNSDAQTVAPPEVIFYLSDQISIRGVLSGSVSCNWKLPLIEVNGKQYMSNCDVSITIIETTGPYSMADVRSMRGRRVK